MDYNIDLVYSWVDGNDEDWLKKKNFYLQNTTNLDIDATTPCRFFNNDELKYSLRSVEKYANWINKIFIITDNQIPIWLNTNNPRIRIVNHSEIIPKDKLPLFNSCAIESRIPFIEDLSEYFLYANDDTYFWKPVTKEFFYEKEKPICRALKFLNRNKIYDGFYTKTIIEAYKKISIKYNPKYYAFLPHHNIDAYKKTTFMDCINKYKKEFDKTLEHKFRDKDDMQRIIVSYFSLVNNQSTFKLVKRNFLSKILNLEADSKIINIKKHTIKRINKINTKLLCLNDNPETTNQDRDLVKKILEQKFNKKSCFEK